MCVLFCFGERSNQSVPVCQTAVMSVPVHCFAGRILFIYFTAFHSLNIHRQKREKQQKTVTFLSHAKIYTQGIRGH